MKNLFRNGFFLVLLAALAFAPGTVRATSRTWVGTGTGDWFSAGNWNPAAIPQAGDDVTIAGGAALLSNSTFVLNSLTVTNATLIFTNWATVLYATNVNVRSGGRLTTAPAFSNVVTVMSNRLYVVCTNFTLDTGGMVEADGKGYDTDSGPGMGLVGAYAGAGGYGGKGGDGGNSGGSGSAAGVPYGSPSAPALPGSGGGSYLLQSSYRGAAGGGAIHIDAWGTLTVNGTISANGNSATAAANMNAGAGSGGAVWLQCGTLGGTTSGLIQVKGGDILYVAVGPRGGGGGGGRIAVNYKNLAAQHAVRFTASGGTNGWCPNDWDRNWFFAPQPGTLYLPDGRLLSPTLTDQQFNDVQLSFGTNRWAVNSLLVSNCGIRFADDAFQLIVTNGLTIDNGSVALSSPYAISNGTLLSVGTDLVLTNGGRLYVYSGMSNDVADYGAQVFVNGQATLAPGSWIYPFAHTNNGGAVGFQVNSLTIMTNAGINADGKGFFWDRGPGKGIAGTYASGAGYGGKGAPGIGGFADPGGIYGSVSVPVQPGSGGGTYQIWLPSSRGGAGGGTVRFNVTTVAKVDGTISADAQHAGWAAGGGSGGAIDLACGTFDGRGSLSVVGGNGVLNGATACGGGGGGGRIAVTYTTLTTPCAARFNALPGTNYFESYVPTPGDRRMAADGTLYFSDGAILSTNPVGLFGFLTFPALTSWSPASLTVSNAFLGLPDSFQLSVGGDILVSGSNGVLVIGTNSQASCGGNLMLTNGGQVRVYSGPTNDVAGSYDTLVVVPGQVAIASNSWIYAYCEPTNGGAPLFRMGALDVAGGGGISADAGGYLWDQGPGKGTPGTGGGGGAHGGKGGDGSFGGGTVYAGSSITYDSTNAPIRPGSGGGTYQNAGNSRGGPGGGVIRAEVSGAVTLNGTVTANGGLSEHASGAGAGGSIFLTCATFTGGNSGSLLAHGGNGQLGNNSGGGGGGGRIAVGIGLSNADRDNLLAGNPVARLSAYLVHAPYAGTVSVAGGFGWTNFPTGGAAAGSQWFLSTNLILTVVGVPAYYDSPSPFNYGTYPYLALGTWITNSVTSPVDVVAGARHTCAGWSAMTAAGGSVTNGTNVQAIFQFTTNSTLVFLWTNEYRLTVSAGANGVVSNMEVNGWYAQNAVVANITATPSNGYTFFKWTGDVPSGQDTVNPLTVTMDQERNLVANFVSNSGQINVWNGVGVWENIGNWSLSSIPSTLDSAIIASGTVLVRSAVQVTELTINGGAVLVCSNWNTSLTASNVTIQTGGILTLPPAWTNGQNSNRVYVICTNFLLAAGGLVDVEGRGYGTDTGPGAGSIGTYAGGAGHGGRGGDGNGALAGPAYDSIVAPQLPGSGGGTYQYTDGNRGAAGGGVVRIEASTATVDGTITAGGSNTVTAANHAAGAGAGGSIYILCRTFGGDTTGVLRAQGGSAIDSSLEGAGAGGRIAVAYSTLAAQHGVKFSASPGTNGWHSNDWDDWRVAAPEMGTLSLPDGSYLSPTLSDRIFQDVRLYFNTNRWCVDSLSVADCSVIFAADGFQLTVSNGLWIDNGGILGVGAVNGSNATQLAVGQDLMLTNGGKLYLWSGMSNPPTADFGGLFSVTGTVAIGPRSWLFPFAHTTNGGAIRMQMSALAVATNGGINADGKGYYYDQGPGKGGGGAYAYWGSGGHGGKGSDGSDGSSDGGIGGTTYGSLTNPITAGSGGATYSIGPTSRAGLGGGVIRVMASTVSVDGTLTANGGLGGHASGAGAGGSVCITCSDFSGSTNGVIRAQGGEDFDTAWPAGGGGGGGRIAVRYTTLGAQHNPRLSTLPGYSPGLPTPGDWRAAFPGTVYLPDMGMLGTNLTGFAGYINVPGFTSCPPASLTLDNSCLAFPTGFALNVAGNMLISGSNGCLLINPNAAFTCGGNLWLTNSGQLRIYGAATNGAVGRYGSLMNVGGLLALAPGSWLYTYADITNGGAPLIRCGQLFVDASAGINADAAGFRYDQGPGTSVSATWAGGAGYGGAGGDGTGGLGGPAYGSSNTPVAAGSGGASYQEWLQGERGGYGGGAVRVEASGDMTINGTIRANGELAQNAAGGGSGGSILLISGGAINGSLGSDLRVQGGTAGANTGGGGGGRIALWYKIAETSRIKLMAGDFNRAIITETCPTFLGQVRLDGGSGGYRNGANGTVVYLTAQPNAAVILTIW